MSWGKPPCINSFDLKYVSFKVILKWLKLCDFYNERSTGEETDVHNNHSWNKSWKLTNSLRCNILLGKTDPRLTDKDHRTNRQTCKSSLHTVQVLEQHVQNHCETTRDPQHFTSSTEITKISPHLHLCGHVSSACLPTLSWPLSKPDETHRETSSTLLYKQTSTCS